jgi:enoyl-CoA hydratase/carnithine racemase
LVGLSRGLDMLAMAKAISPADAHEVGLVDRLLPDAATCRAAAIDYCTAIADGPSEAIGRAKVAACLGYGLPLDAGLALEGEAIGRVFVSDDAPEGISAFVEKRAPAFHGR